MKYLPNEIGISTDELQQIATRIHERTSGRCFLFRGLWWGNVRETAHF
jgi:hypothetical protein